MFQARVLLLMLAIVQLTAAANDGLTVGEDVNITLVPSAQYVLEGVDFVFYCNASIAVNISLLIDGYSTGPKFDRVMGQIEGDANSTRYIFNGTRFVDNGTSFVCEATEDDMTYTSENFTLLVYYEPKLVEGNNNTELMEVLAGSNPILTVTVMSANPPVMFSNITYDADNITGVQFEYNNQSANVSFKPGYPSNRGNYTFTFANEIGETSFTYRTFVGDAANKLNVTCTNTNGSRVIINCTLTDTSDAPATGAVFAVPGLIEEDLFVEFSQIPVTDQQIIVVNISVTDVTSANYTLSVEAINQLKNLTVFTDSYFISGTKIDVLINSSMDYVLESGNFTFTCTTPDHMYSNFTVLVNGAVADQRIVPEGPAVNGSQSFVFTDTVSTDDGAAIKCRANNSWDSSDLILTVYYEPILTNSTTLFGAYANASLVLSIIVQSNPVNYTTVWLKDGAVFNGGDGITITRDNITFSSLVPDDNGTYTANVTNIVGSTILSIDLQVYYGPIFKEFTNASQWVEHATGSDFKLECVLVRAYPEVTSLTLSSPNCSLPHSNCQTMTNSTSLLEIIVTKANQSNRQNYTCTATTSKAKSTTNYQSFVGGAPDRVKVVITNTTSDSGQTIVFSITATDSSDAPARSIIYTNPETGKNKSFLLTAPLINGRSFSEPNFYEAQADGLGAGEHTLEVFAANRLGSAKVTSVTFTFPAAPVHKKSKGGAIAAGILVPVIVICLAAGAAIAIFYYMKRRRGVQFSPLKAMQDTERDVTTSSYGTTNS